MNQVKAYAMNFTKFALNKAETVALNSNNEFYYVHEVHDMIATAHKEYERQYNIKYILTPEIMRKIEIAIETKLEDMGITVK